MSNIEEDIKILKNAIKYNKRQFEEIGTHILLQDDEQKAITHILLEREQDKKKIEELEEENHIQRSQIMTVYDNGWIPKQKVKDILQNNRNELFGVIYLNSKQYEPYEKQIERINKIEKELLEDKQ